MLSADTVLCFLPIYPVTLPWVPHHSLPLQSDHLPPSREWAVLMPASASPDNLSLSLSKYCVNFSALVLPILPQHCCYCPQKIIQCIQIFLSVQVIMCVSCWRQESHHAYFIFPAAPRPVLNTTLGTWLVDSSDPALLPPGHLSFSTTRNCWVIIIIHRENTSY